MRWCGEGVSRAASDLLGAHSGARDWFPSSGTSILLRVGEEVLLKAAFSTRAFSASIASGLPTLPLVEFHTGLVLVGVIGPGRHFLCPDT